MKLLVIFKHCVISAVIFFYFYPRTLIQFDFFLLQYWMLSKTGEIRRDEACLDYAGSDVILYPCHGSKGNQFWTYDHEVWQSF